MCDSQDESQYGVMMMPREGLSNKVYLWPWLAKPRLETLLARKGAEPFLILLWIYLSQETKTDLPLLMFSRKINNVFDYLMGCRGKPKVNMGRYALFGKNNLEYTDLSIHQRSSFWFSLLTTIMGWGCTWTSYAHVLHLSWCDIIPKTKLSQRLNM